jgi:hypothetical protein
MFPTIKGGVMSPTRLFEWHKLFMEDREEVEDDESPGRNLTSNTEENIQKISEILRKDQSMKIRMIAEMVNVHKKTVG